MKKIGKIITILFIAGVLILSYIIIINLNTNEFVQKTVIFPEDDWPHQESTEWYYWTGHLQTESGRWFGYLLVYFIIEIDGQETLVVNHAISDISNDSFHYTNELSSENIPKKDEPLKFEAGLFTALIEGNINQIYAEVDNYTIDLDLENFKPPTLQHGNGYYDYSFGGYTYYYSRTRMQTNGTLTIDNISYNVTGNSWFDHQWGDLTTVSSVGWDWFAIQLDDGREIMLFNVHSGYERLLIGGTLTDIDGKTEEILSEEFEISVTEEWESPHTGIIYPSGWIINIKDINLQVTPILKDQELAFTDYTRFWEGACIVEGDLTGRAYVELVGGRSSTPVITGENMLKNSGFENETSGSPLHWNKAWIPNENLIMYLDDEIRYNGSKSISIKNTHVYDEIVYNNWRQSVEQIPKGQTLTLSCWIKTTDAEDVDLFIQLIDNDNKMIDVGATQSTITGTTDWQMYTASIMVSDETEKINVRLGLTGTGQVWFDDVKLVAS